MTSVTQKTSYDPGAQLEDGMSIPAEAPKTAQPAAPAPTPEAKKDEDSFGFVDSVKSFFGVEKPAAKKTETKYGPNNLPKPPAEPREKTIPTKGLTGKELEKAQDANSKLWGEYEVAYKQYLSDFREAYKNCGSLEQLRQLQPEPPATTLRDVNYSASYESALSRYNEMFKEKVDRGYELIGKTPPGTLTAIFGASLKGKVGAIGGSIDGKFQVDTRGKTKREVSNEASVEVESNKFAMSSKGVKSETMDVGVAKIKTNTKGDGEVSVSMGAGSGTAFYNPSEGTFGGGVKVGKSVDLGVIEVGVEASVKAQIQGMSKEDVKRVLSGWLVPVPQEANAKLLQEQQLKATTSR
ncbi:MAG: hypothetical protein QM765_43605 [Myxococcales bacterium]